MLDTNDVELVRRAQQGDSQAIGELYDSHRERTFRYVWSRVYDVRLAEDITGEVFMRMVERLHTYEPGETPLQAWLYRIARNLIIDQYRKRGRFAEGPLHEVIELTMDFDHNPSVIVEQQLTVERIRLALDRLEPAQRDVVELRFLGGLSLNEVATVLDKTVPSVKTLQHRGLLALRTALRQS